MKPQIAIVNESTVLTDAQVSAIVPALQTQVTRDFAPFYSDATIVYYLKGMTPLPTDWVIAILDDSDQAGALGYHDLTAQGMPLAKVFAKSDIAFGSSWSITISHELLEMLADPDINLAAEGEDGFYAYEVCDAVEDDGLGYEIDGVKVSDFVLPAWFSPQAQGPFSFKASVSMAFALAEGGYISVFANRGWVQRNARTAAILGGDKVKLSRMVAGAGSRRERRRRPRAEWVISAQIGIKF